MGQTTPVDRYLNGASPYGCLDMAGNVWEWTSTKWTDDYRGYDSVVNNAVDGEAWRVVRGGAFSSNDTSVRATYRYGGDQDFSHDNYGFRVVWSPPFGEI